MIDFSSPNVAKPMHVGHLRSTVIGDSLARIVAALGHQVIRDNHLGDWGSQFGMILWGWKNARDERSYAADPVGELARLYRLAQDRIKAGDIGRRGRRPGRDRQAPRRRPREPGPLGAVHAPLPGCAPGDLRPPGRPVRRPARRELLRPACWHRVVADLEKQGLAVESEGAIVVFVEETEAPFIVRKRDGAFNYATTDLATIKYRVETWHPDQVLYVVDHRQGDHFKQLFEVARKWGYDSVDLEHVAFGTILGADRRPFKTREGDVVGLESLLDEATAEARKVVDENSPELDRPSSSASPRSSAWARSSTPTCRRTGISDYVFDWQKMMAMNGNTATYLQYAYARIQSIFRKGGFAPRASASSAPRSSSTHPAERALGVRLLRLPEVLELAASELQAQYPDRLPVRPRQRVQHVLRGMPGPEGRVSRAPR